MPDGIRQPRRGSASWTALVLALPLLYLHQLAPHAHETPHEATDPAAAAHLATPHDHSHDHRHHGDPGQTAPTDRDEAHHHHALASHLDLHAPPAVSRPIGATAAVAAVIPTTSSLAADRPTRAQPPEVDPPPLLRRPASPPAPRGPPRGA